MIYNKDRFPQAGDICTICYKEMHKRAALLFDRVYVGTDNKDREDFDTPVEITFGVTSIDDQWATFSKPNFKEIIKSEHSLEKVVLIVFKLISDIYKSSGYTIIPGYFNHSQFENEFKQTGEEIVYEAALNFIPVISDDDVSWDQILEFRKDREAIRKYRDLRMWFRDGLSCESVTEVIDLIGAKIDAYDWSLRKHGLKTVSGAITFVTDFKQAGITTAVGTAGAALGGPILAALSSGLVVAGQMTSWIIERYIEKEDAKRTNNSEIAYIYDVKRKFEL